MGHALGVSVMLDVEGRRVETKHEEFAPGGASLAAGNKTVEVRRDGTLKIEAAKREAR